MTTCIKRRYWLGCDHQFTMCICVKSFNFTHTHMYTHIHIYMNAHTHTHTHTHTYTQMYSQRHIHIGKSKCFLNLKKESLLIASSDDEETRLQIF